MRNIAINTNNYKGEIVTNDMYVPRFGKKFLNITISDDGPVPDDVIVKCAGYTFKQHIDEEKFKNGEEIIFSFNFDWFQYINDANISVVVFGDVKDDSHRIATISYRLYDGRDEILIDGVNLPTEFNFYADAKKLEELIVWASTQKTKHWNTFEFLAKKALNRNVMVSTNKVPIGSDEVYEEGFDTRTIASDTASIYLMDANSLNYIKVMKTATHDATCADIELRIKNRHGMRGAIGGKIIDASEGGDAEKSRIETPYNGIYKWSKKGATIKKEVAFNFEGDNGLLSLLRDGCVYGDVEWYDEVSAQWLPCSIQENSLPSTDPYEEQTITIIFQEL